MAQESQRNLRCFDSLPVIRDSDERNASFFDFYRNGICPRVNRIFHELFHNGSRAFYDLARCNFINGILV